MVITHWLLVFSSSNEIFQHFYICKQLMKQNIQIYLMQLCSMTPTWSDHCGLDSSCGFTGVMETYCMWIDVIAVLVITVCFFWLDGLDCSFLPREQYVSMRNFIEMMNPDFSEPCILRAGQSKHLMSNSFNIPIKMTLNSYRLQLYFGTKVIFTWTPDISLLTCCNRHWPQLDITLTL